MTMYLHHTDRLGNKVFSFGCMEAIRIRTPRQKIEEYREWLVDHPDADQVAISEIRSRIKQLEIIEQEFIDELKKLDK